MLLRDLWLELKPTIKHSHDRLTSFLQANRYYCTAFGSSNLKKAATIENDRSLNPLKTVNFTFSVE